LRSINFDKLGHDAARPDPRARRDLVDPRAEHPQPARRPPTPPPVAATTTQPATPPPAPPGTLPPK
jgi:hypothetical protein